MAIKAVSQRKLTEQSVYDITVEGIHSYFVEDIMVHNCMDSLSYTCVMLDENFNRPKRTKKGYKNHTSRIKWWI